MPLIDDDGDLFGVVNVIDALVVLLVCAVLVAGVAFVGVLGSTDDGPTGNGAPEDGVTADEPGFATIDLGQLSTHTADRVVEGENLSGAPADERTATIDGNLTITDVYTAPASSDDRGEYRPHVIVRVAVTGDSPRIGDRFHLETDAYAVTGDVTDVADETETLERTDTPVLLEAIVSERTADELAGGDRVTVGAHTAATMTNVSLYPVGDDQYRALVGAELATLERGTTPTYGGQSVTVGSQLSLPTDVYALEATVVRRGTDREPGDATTTAATIELENVDPAVADGLRAGMTETVRGETLATIESVESRPAAVVLESDDGNIHLREHPRNVDVTLSVALQARQTGSDSRVSFHGESLREGEPVVLEFKSIAVEGTVTRID